MGSSTASTSTCVGGEVVGIAGLAGSGRTELAQAIFGVRPFDAGTMTIEGRDVRMSRPRQAIGRGLGFVTEDRKAEGLVLGLGVRENALLALRGLGAWLRGRLPRRASVSELAEQVDLRTTNLERDVRFLSGGNQQKVVLAKWLATRSRIFLFDEPTRGIDVGAKAGIHELIRELARAGAAVLMISSELPEVIGMSDRILVMRSGTIAGELRCRPDRGRHHVPGHGRARGAGRMTASRDALTRRRSPFDAVTERISALGIPPAWGVLLLLVLIAVATAGTRFISQENLTSILVRSVSLGLVAAGQTIAILAGSLDLSVAYLISVAAVLSGVVMQGDPARIPLGVGVVLLIGAGVGLVNGLLITKLRINAFIATLGVGAHPARRSQRGLHELRRRGPGLIPGARVRISRPDPVLRRASCWWWLAPSGSCCAGRASAITSMPSAATRRPPASRACAAIGRSSSRTSCAASRRS